MKSLRKRFAAVIFVLLLAPMTPVLAEALPGNVLIVELQTGGAGTGTATHEFVELYNPTASNIDITGWKLQYRAANKLPADAWAASGATTIGCLPGSPAGCSVVLSGHGRVVLATATAGIINALNLNGGFTDAGGQIRLVQPNGTVEDFVGYGTALDFEGAAVSKPAGGESLKRKIDSTGVYIDTGNNEADFTLGCGEPSPADVRQPVAGTVEGCPLFELPDSEPETPPVELPNNPEPEQPPNPEPPLPETSVPPDPEPAEPPSDPQPEEPQAPELPPQEPPAPPEPEPIPQPEEPQPDPIPPEQTPPTYLPLDITEVFPDPTSPQTDAADEFVELFNPNDQAVDTTGYKLKITASTERLVELPSASVPAGGYVVVKSANSTLSLVNTGAATQLIDPIGAVRSESPNYQAAHAGESWAKNATTWEWTTSPTPLAANIITQPEPPAEEPNTPTEPEQPTEPTPTEPEPTPEEPAPGQGGGTLVYLPVLITELLPDPASPSQDATDEFIELFNPNSLPISLKDYQLQSGSNYRYHYTLPDVTLGAGQYLVIMSEESGLSLSNSGSSVRVLDPNGTVADEVASYGKAEEGQSWAKTTSGQWQWSTTTTPGAVNVTTLPVKTVKAAAAKTTAAKKATTAKPKVASATKAKAAETNDSSNPFAEPAAPPPNYWLLAGVGSMALGYGVYEYRQGLLGGVRKLWSRVRGKTDES